MQQPLHKAIVHVDLDAFYAQVEVKQHPALRGKSLGVVQYNPYGSLETRRPDEDRVMNDSNGSLIAVSYEARAQGVKRNMRGDAARAACPELQLVQVPTAHGKADLTLYRAEGKRVLDILARLAKTERASIDECYLDLTAEAQRRLEASNGTPQFPCNPEQVHVMQEAGFVGAAAWWQRPPQDWQAGERLLACAAAAVAELRQAVHDELGYTCSAGIAHTKLMAKLCSGLHKPCQQTVLPAVAVPALLGPLPIPKLRGLGAKFGEQVMSELGIQTVGELAATPLARLESLFGEKDAQWLAGLARGVTDEAVEERKLSKSVSCGKTFRGRSALRDVNSVHSWLLELGAELSERLEADREANNRQPQLLTVSFGTQVPWAVQAGAAQQGQHTSRSCPLRKFSAEAIADDATALVRRWTAEQRDGWTIASLYIAAGNFVPVQSAASAITRFFKPASTADQQPEQQQQLKQQGQEQEQQVQEHGQEHRQQQQQLQPGQEQQAQQPPSGVRQQEHQKEEQESMARWHAPGGRPVHATAAEAQQQVQAPPATIQQKQQGAPPVQQQVQQPHLGVQGLLQHKEHRPQVAMQPPLQQQTAMQRQELQVQAPTQRQQQVQAPMQQQQQQQQQKGCGTDGVDESVLAELPPELQREIRSQLKTQQMLQHLDRNKGRAGHGGGGSSGDGGSSSGAPAGSAGMQAARAGGAKRPASAGTRRIDAFFGQPDRGKKPKQ